MIICKSTMCSLVGPDAWDIQDLWVGKLSNKCGFSFAFRDRLRNTTARTERRFHSQYIFGTYFFNIHESFRAKWYSKYQYEYNSGQSDDKYTTSQHSAVELGVTNNWHPLLFIMHKLHAIRVPGRRKFFCFFMIYYWWYHIHNHTY